MHEMMPTRGPAFPRSFLNDGHSTKRVLASCRWRCRWSVDLQILAIMELDFCAVVLRTELT